MNKNGNEEPTKDLTADLSDRQLLLLLVGRVDALSERIGRLEAAEEDRARETRPLWQRLDGQVTGLIVQVTDLSAQVADLSARTDILTVEVREIKDQNKRIRLDISILREDIRNERVERLELALRVTDLEHAVAQQAA